LSRTPGALPHIEACEFEERAGRAPEKANDDDVDRIYIVYIKMPRPIDDHDSP
jgi:hypothetical protein